MASTDATAPPRDPINADSAFRVDLTVEGHAELVCRATPLRERDGVKFSYRIRCNELELHAPCFLPQRELRIRLERSGFYWAEVWMNVPGTPSVTTPPIQHFASPDRDSYLRWRASDSTCQLPELALYQSEHPYQEIALVGLLRRTHRHGLATTLKQTAKRDQLLLSRLPTPGGRLYLLSTTEPVTTGDGAILAFSGIARHETDLFVGQDDLSQSGIKGSRLLEQVGDFNLVLASASSVSFSSDYFGLSRIFYYRGRDLFVAANGYHLLLRILARLGVCLSLDPQKVRAGFFDCGSLMQTNVSHRMDIQDVYQLPVDHRIDIRRGTVQLVPTTLRQELRDPPAFEERDYRRLLMDAREEIIDNVRAAADHPAFKRLRIDLTGGMDSRLIYGAATHLPERTDKLVVYTNIQGNNLPGELAVAAAVNSAYRLPLDVASYTMRAEALEGNVLRQSPYSAFMGTYYAHEPFYEFVREPTTLVANGLSGEACTRAYMRRWFPSGQSVEKIVAELIYGRGKSTVSLQSGVRDLLPLLVETIQSVPGRSVDERLDNLYLYMRNGYHSSAHFKPGCVAWTPLQSRAAFRAKLMRFAVHVDTKPAHDLMELMNPLLSLAPYASSEQNAERTQLRNELVVGLAVAAHFDMDPSAVEESVSQRNDSMIPLPDSGGYAQAVDSQNRFLADDRPFLAALRSLLDELAWFDDLGLPLYTFLNRDPGEIGLRYGAEVVRNRILSTYYQMRLCQESEQSAQDDPAERRR